MRPLPRLTASVLLALAGAILPSPRGFAQVDAGTKIRTVEAPRAATTRLAREGVFREIVVPRPVPSRTMAELDLVNPGLSKAVPGLVPMLAKAEVSTRFAQLYDAKLATIRRGRILSRHNYFDCDTILRLEHPATGQKVLLVQGDMDSVTDGSDPGRASRLSDYNLARTSDWYLPETAYSWTGPGGVNPFLAYYPEAKSRLSGYRSQFEKEAARDRGVVWRELIKACDAQIYRVEQRGMLASTRDGLQRRRFLLSDRDPFVVLPKSWVVGKQAFSANVGDYAIVVAGGKLLPAILGDAGPDDKVGEASLKLARAVQPKASGTYRAVSDLSVTYLFFPRSADPRGTPDLARWNQKCAALLGRIGGAGQGFELHRWE